MKKERSELEEQIACIVGLWRRSRISEERSSVSPRSFHKRMLASGLLEDRIPRCRLGNGADTRKAKGENTR